MITFSHNCPHCGVNHGGFEIRGWYAHEHKNEFGYSSYKFSLMAVCNRCKCAIVADTEYLEKYIATEFNNLLKDDKWSSLEMFLLDNNLEKLSFSPKEPSINVPEHLAEQVNKDARTAEKLYLQAMNDDDIVESAATAYRKTLESALAELSGKQDKSINLCRRINLLVDEGLLVKSMGDFAHRIRFLGNSATHDSLSKNELTEIRCRRSDLI